jgi:VWFA-related protein
MFLSLALFPLLAGTAFAQTPAPSEPETAATTLKITARSVLVDVVVKDKDGRAVPGLRAEDFQVNENGKRQKVDFFESHFPSAAGAVTAAPPLPPNTFTNVPAAAPSEAINVLLMDALNTTNMRDQMLVRQQMVKYLGTLPPGMRIGVFTLSDRLRIIQGFTDNSELLRASVARLAAKPNQVALQAITPDELAAQTTALNRLGAMTAEGQGSSDQGAAQFAESISTMQAFLAEGVSAQQNQQLLVTLESLQTIAHYLSAIPGRKNLIWFVGSFPLCIPSITTSRNGCPYEDEVEKTINALAAARVSVYPIDAGGVIGPNEDITRNGDLAVINAHQPQSLQASAAAPDANPISSTIGGNFAFIASEGWAKSTGGKAYHDNDLKEGLADAVQDGSSYYTLAYTPKIGEELGRERKIEVSIPTGKYKLAYHHSYFEQTPKEVKAAASTQAKDPLRPLMDRGMPSFFDLQYRAHVEPAAVQPAAGAPIAGDNPSLARPFTRYTVRFALSPNQVNLVKGPDGVSRQNVEVALLIYSQEGKPLNWMVRFIGLAIRPEQMPIAQASGIPFRFDIDAPAGDVYLRTGIYDASTSKAGTLEIPLSSVVVARQ